MPYVGRDYGSKPDMLSKSRFKEEIAFEKDRAQRKLEIQMDGGSRRQKRDEKSRKSLQGKLRRHCAKRGRAERRQKNDLCDCSRASGWSKFVSGLDTFGIDFTLEKFDI